MVWSVRDMAMDVANLRSICRRKRWKEREPWRSVRCRRGREEVMTSAYLYSTCVVLIRLPQIYARSSIHCISRPVSMPQELVFPPPEEPSILSLPLPHPDAYPGEPREYALALIQRKDAIQKEIASL